MFQQRRFTCSKAAQQGFTLIELMIVVAIIAILAAIAIPQYNDYTARAQLSEAFSLADGMKTQITEFYSQDSDQAHYCSAGSYPNAVTTGKYVDGITLAGNCVMTVTMKKGINTKIAGLPVIFTFTPDTASVSNKNSRWDCSSPIDASALPKSCTSK